MYRIYHLQVIRAITESRTNNMIILEACPLSRTTTPPSTVWLLLLLLLLLLKVSVRFSWPTILLTLMCMLMDWRSKRRWSNILCSKQQTFQYQLVRFLQHRKHWSDYTTSILSTNYHYWGHRFKCFYVNGQAKINRCLSSNLLKNNWTNMYQMKWKQNIYLMFH